MDVDVEAGGWKGEEEANVEEWENVEEGVTGPMARRDCA